VENTPSGLSTAPADRPRPLPSPAAHPPPEQPWVRFLTLAEAAGVLRVDVATLNAEAMSGRLPTVTAHGMFYLDGARLLEAFKSPVDELSPPATV
jgi:hypothetical protein